MTVLGKNLADLPEPPAFCRATSNVNTEKVMEAYTPAPGQLRKQLTALNYSSEFFKRKQSLVGFSADSRQGGHGDSQENLH